MKTDLDRFIELYKSIGVQPKVINDYNKDNNIGTVLILEVTPDSEPLIDGYWGFRSEAYFDMQGKFIKFAFCE